MHAPLIVHVHGVALSVFSRYELLAMANSTQTKTKPYGPNFIACKDSFAALIAWIKSHVDSSHMKPKKKARYTRTRVDAMVQFVEDVVFFFLKYHLTTTKLSLLQACLNGGPKADAWGCVTWAT